MNKTKEGNFAIFFASFATLLAAGMGTALRAGGMLADWGGDFGFTKSELGSISGFAFWGFGLTIIFFSFFSDLVGYKALLMLAFILHLSSFGVMLAAKPIYDSIYNQATASANTTNTTVTLVAQNGGNGENDTTSATSDSARTRAKNWAWWIMSAGMWLFSLANGVCEAAINPLVATLYPTKKTHYLNVLHAGWPGGLILGAGLAYLFVGRGAVIAHLPWQFALGFFLIPTFIYGLIVLVKPFPISEAKAAGVGMGTMLLQFTSPILLFLLVLHAMVGYVELGVDNWMADIMSNIVYQNAVLVLLYTSVIMFVLRFFAGPIVERINPVGLLLVSAVLAAVGLYSLSWSAGLLLVFGAATIYGVGKTFFWSTMLGVVSERFPKGGAIALGMSGGMGMLSAGLLGAPIIGYNLDHYAAEDLKQESDETFQQYKAEEKSYLFLPSVAGLDGDKVEAVKDKQKEVFDLERKGEPVPEDEKLTVEDKQVLEASLNGGRMTLRRTALVPAMMAVGYLLLFLYFMAKGGYKQEMLQGQKPDGEKYTGGVEGPMR